jgi:negative regulator of sigma-B (phosphoserine phosphatase)
MLLERCHEELRRTRGAVMTLAWFDLEERTMSWTGVGNVEARFIRAGDGPDRRFDSPVVLGGVVGYNLPQVRMSTIPLEPGDAVVFATDGVAADYSVSLESGVPAQELADRVLERHGKGTDDALAAAVRYLGPPARP